MAANVVRGGPLMGLAGAGLRERFSEQRFVELKSQSDPDLHHAQPIAQDQHKDQKDLHPAGMWRPVHILELQVERNDDGQGTELFDAACEHGKFLLHPLVAIADEFAQRFALAEREGS